VKGIFETVVFWLTLGFLGALTLILGVFAAVFPFIMMGVVVAIPVAVVLFILRLFGLI
jgi:hypothetical protein